MIVYVPALLSGMEFQVRKARTDSDYLWKGYDGGWFTDKSMYLHDHVLTSYYYSKKIKDYRAELAITDTTKLWADSGGFSLATKGASIDPRTVIEWQNDNADCAFTLDLPPIEVAGGNQTSSGSFEYISLGKLKSAAITTAHNNDVFFKLRRPDLKIYNVIHGNRLSYMNEWWKYNGHFDFEGYATGSKPAGDALYQAFNIAFLHSKGARSHIHLLGVSGIRVLPAVAYMARYIDWLSFDSTSYGRGALNRTYMIPDKLNEHISFAIKDYEPGSVRREDLTCECPVCQKIETPEQFAESGTWPGMLCALHNLYVIKDWIQELNSIIDDESKFKANVEQMTGEKFEHSMTAKAIDFFEHYLRNGIEDAYMRFFPSKEQSEYKRRTLFT
jgi:tRNA-guanine family transglycosylase